MTPTEQEKQQEAGIRWMEMLAEQKRQPKPAGAGVTFFGLVVLAVSAPLAELSGSSMIARPGIFYYIAIFLAGMGILYLLWKLTAKLAFQMQNLVFWGAGWVVGLSVLWFTQSSELLRNLILFLVISLVFELWQWMRRKTAKAG